MLIITALLTVLLLPLIAVMAWRCWSLPPVPEIRIWSLAFVAMTLAMLLQAWRAQLWQTRFERLTPQRQESQLQSLLYPQFAPNLTSWCQDAGQFRVVPALCKSQSCLVRKKEAACRIAPLRNTFDSLAVAGSKVFFFSAPSLRLQLFAKIGVDLPPQPDISAH